MPEMDAKTAREKLLDAMWDADTDADVSPSKCERLLDAVLDPACRKLVFRAIATSDNPTLADAYRAGEDDTEGACGKCGDAIYLGQWLLMVPAGYGPPNMVVAVHLSCAVRDDPEDGEVMEIDLGLVG